MRAPTATPAATNYYDGLNLKLLDAIPAKARRVLELGCANGLLGRRFKELHPGVTLDEVKSKTGCPFSSNL